MLDDFEYRPQSPTDIAKDLQQELKDILCSEALIQCRIDRVRGKMNTVVVRVPELLDNAVAQAGAIHGDHPLQIVRSDIMTEQQRTAGLMYEYEEDLRRLLHRQDKQHWAWELIWKTLRDATFGKVDGLAAPYFTQEQPISVLCDLSRKYTIATLIRDAIERDIARRRED